MLNISSVNKGVNKNRAESHNEGDELHVNPFLMLSAFISPRLSALPLVSAEPGTIHSRYFDQKNNNIVTLLGV